MNSSTEETINHSMGPDEKRKVLKERAKVLAKAPKGMEESEAYLEVVEFMLAHERYALELTHIREVHPLKDLTALPGTPGFVLGIINVRGQILSVIDIKKFFDFPEKGLTDLNQVIILQSDEMEFGILADEILGTSSIPASNIQALLPTLTGIRAEYLKGVTGDRLVILDADRLLSDKKILLE